MIDGKADTTWRILLKFDKRTLYLEYSFFLWQRKKKTFCESAERNQNYFSTTGHDRSPILKIFVNYVDFFSRFQYLIQRLRFFGRESSNINNSWQCRGSEINQRLSVSEDVGNVWWDFLQYLSILNSKGYQEPSNSDNCLQASSWTQHPLGFSCLSTCVWPFVQRIYSRLERRLNERRVNASGNLLVCWYWTECA